MAPFRYARFESKICYPIFDLSTNHMDGTQNRAGKNGTVKKSLEQEGSQKSNIGMTENHFWGPSLFGRKGGVYDENGYKLFYGK